MLNTPTLYLFRLYLTPPQQLLKRKIVCRFDLLFDQHRVLLGPVCANTTIEGGSNVEVVGLVIEGVFVLGCTDALHLVASPSH